MQCEVKSNVLAQFYYSDWWQILTQATRSAIPFVQKEWLVRSCNRAVGTTKGHVYLRKGRWHCLKWLFVPPPPLWLADCSSRLGWKEVVEEVYNAATWWDGGQGQKLDYLYLAPLLTPGTIQAGWAFIPMATANDEWSNSMYQFTFKSYCIATDFRNESKNMKCILDWNLK